MSLFFLFLLLSATVLPCFRLSSIGILHFYVFSPSLPTLCLASFHLSQRLLRFVFLPSFLLPLSPSLFSLRSISRVRRYYFSSLPLSKWTVELSSVRYPCTWKNVHSYAFHPVSQTASTKLPLKRFQSLVAIKLYGGLVESKDIIIKDVRIIVLRCF